MRAGRSVNRRDRLFDSGQNHEPVPVIHELQASRSQNATLKNRRPIGFIQHKEDDE